MLIDGLRYEIGDEIDCGSIHGRGRDNYGVTIRKISDAEWIAYKFPFRTEEKIPLRRGDLTKIVDYLNRNFGYNCLVAQDYSSREC